MVEDKVSPIKKRAGYTKNKGKPRNKNRWRMAKQSRKINARFLKGL